ncbi:MAG TPA: hypothetical protein VH593_19700 [Ktedonobacteraceae bacterium]|jgi:hypothetical protein
MNNKSSVGKTLALAYSAVAAFATAFIIGGIIWDKQANKRRPAPRK